jgi:hypothetical protein
MMPFGRARTIWSIARQRQLFAALRDMMFDQLFYNGKVEFYFEFI